MQRSLVEGLDAFEAGLCECGFHTSLTRDEGQQFAVEVVRCPVCADAQRFKRMQDEQDEKDRGPKPAADRSDPADGRSAMLRYKGPVTGP